MVLEQGALTGAFNKEHPFPIDSDRGRKYNPLLDQLDVVNNALNNLARKHQATISQIATAYVIHKGTLPIIGATKVKHVTEAYEASNIALTNEEVKSLEEVASKLHLNTIREWEKEMK